MKLVAILLLMSAAFTTVSCSPYPTDRSFTNPAGVYHVAPSKGGVYVFDRK